MIFRQMFDAASGTLPLIHRGEAFPLAASTFFNLSLAETRSA